MGTLAAVAVSVVLTVAIIGRPSCPLLRRVLPERSRSAPAPPPYRRAGARSTATGQEEACLEPLWALPTVTPDHERTEA